MIKIIISGCNGHMGHVVASIARDDPDVSVVAGFDIAAQGTQSFPVYSNPMEFTGCADVIIDFSDPAALENLLSFGLTKKTPLILCTTGYTPGHIAAIEEAAKQIPVFRSGNMSLGINLLVDLIKRACSVLGSAYDIEIVERHHRRKVDAPSGTALMLADAAAAALPYEAEYVYDRQSVRQPRGDHEIGISAVRGGTIVGEHEVIFAGLSEVIELKHSAASRDVFATGAIKAAKFMSGISTPGLYDMRDVLSSS